MNPITGTITAIASLITNTLPSDEMKLEWMKLHTPRIYYQVRKHILINAFRYIKRHTKKPDLEFVQNYIDFTCAHFNQEERKQMIDILFTELKK